MTPAPRVTGLLLAAGAGRRAGGPKALRTDEHGIPWVIRTVHVLRDGGCEDVHVVVGAAAPDVRKLLDGLDVTVVEAADWAQGMGASLRAGLEALHTTSADTVCVHLVDLPDVGADVVARVLTAAEGATTLARAAYVDGPGHPVLLGRDHWGGIREAARADHGARDYLAVHPPTLVDCTDLAGGRDVDGPGLASKAPTQTEVHGA